MSKSCRTALRLDRLWKAVAAGTSHALALREDGTLWAWGSNYWGQLGILLAFAGGGLILGGVASLIPLLTKMKISDLFGASSAGIMDKLFTPENAGALRWSQFISTLFLFFLPPVF